MQVRSEVRAEGFRLQVRLVRSQKNPIVAFIMVRETCFLNFHKEKHNPELFDPECFPTASQ
jgi:hypothetical protein